MSPSSNRLDLYGLELRRVTDRLLPLRLRNALYTSKNCVTLWSSAPIPVFLLTGRFRGTDEKGTMIAAGAGTALDYWTNAIFDGEPGRECLGVERMPGLRAFVAKHRSDADITLVRVDDFSEVLWRGDGYLPLPESVAVKAKVPASESAMRRMSRSVRDDMRMIRRHKLQFKMSQADEDLTDFYDNLYRPFTLAKYGSSSFIPPMNWLRASFRSGGLLWVIKDGVRISAMLFGYQRGVLDCVVLGTRDGNLDLLRQGALSGLYVGVVRHAMNLGAREIDFRGCRPALMDGVLRYKLKWQGEMCRKRENVFHKLLVYWPHANLKVKSFLSAMAPVFLTSGKMMAVCAIQPDATPDDIRKKERLMPHSGVDKLGILTPRRLLETSGSSRSTVLMPDTASSADVLAKVFP